MSLVSPDGKDLTIVIETMVSSIDRFQSISLRILDKDCLKWILILNFERSYEITLIVMSIGLQVL